MVAGQLDARALRRILTTEEANAMVLVARHGTGTLGLKSVQAGLPPRNGRRPSLHEVEELIESARVKIAAKQAKLAAENGNGNGGAVMATSEEHRRARDLLDARFRAALRDGPLPQLVVRQWLGIDGPKMTGVKQRLVGLGHIQVCGWDQERRTHELELTSVGMDVLADDPEVDLGPPPESGRTPEPEPELPDPDALGVDAEWARDAPSGDPVPAPEPVAAEAPYGEHDGKGPATVALYVCENSCGYASTEGDALEHANGCGGGLVQREYVRDVDDVGGELARAEADVLDLHDRLTAAGYDGAINAGSVGERIGVLLEQVQLAVSTVDLQAKRLDAADAALKETQRLLMDAGGELDRYKRERDGETERIGAMTVSLTRVLVVVAHENAGLLAELLAAWESRGEPLAAENPHLVALAERTATQVLGE